MDFLTKAYGQLTDLYKSLTPAARITSALLLAVVVISLVYLFAFHSLGGGEYLFGGREFSQTELAAMESAFAQAGLKKWQIVGNRMRVPSGQRDIYLTSLTTYDAVPRDFGTFMEDAAASSGVFESKQQRELKFRSAKQQKIGMVVSRMPGIETATVEYSESEGSGFPRRIEKRALVAVKAVGNRHLDELQVNAIRDAIVKSEAGLDRASVAVLDMNAVRTYNGPSGDDEPSASDSVYAAHKQMYQDFWRGEILRRLVNYPGVVVSVNVELDPEMNREENSREYDPKPVVVASQESVKNSQTTQPEKGGRPGVASNTGNSNSAATLSSSAGPETTVEENASTVQQVTGAKSVTLKKAGLVPKRVTTSIGVPRSYYVKVWRERSRAADGTLPETPDAAELQKIETESKQRIKDVVIALLPKRIQGEDPYEHVIVETDEDLTADPIPEPGLADTAATWFAGNWQTLGLVLLGLVSLVMLRRMVRTAPAKGSAAAEPTPALQLANTPDEEESLGEDATEENKILKRNFGSGGPNLRAELSGLVKEDPEAAAAILRSWIGDAA